MTTSPLLDQFQCCAWDTIRLSRAEIVRVESHVAIDHPGTALVTSCQRLESYGTTPCSCDAPGKWNGPGAVLHLAEVASGLHSIVLGEDQILGQARTGFDSTRGTLRALGDVALASARELRGRTQFNSHAGAMLDRALKFARATAGGRILVLGPGQMGRLIAQRAQDLGFEEVILAGRTLPITQGRVMRPAMLSEIASLGPLDCVAGCLGTAADEIHVEALPSAPLVLDLGTPRNFSGSRPGTVLITLEQLVADEADRPHSMARRHALQVELAEIVERRLGRWFENGDSAIGRIRAESERIRREEVERMLRLHPGMDREAIEAMSHALVNRLMHAPTSRLREEPALEPAALKMFAN